MECVYLIKIGYKNESFNTLKELDEFISENKSKLKLPKKLAVYHSDESLRDKNIRILTEQKNSQLRYSENYTTLYDVLVNSKSPEGELIIPEVRSEEFEKNWKEKKREELKNNFKDISNEDLENRINQEWTDLSTENE